MIDVGDIHLVDLNEEQRSLVLVVSTNRFHQRSGRALVAPQALGPPREAPPPWRIRIGSDQFAVDHLRSIPLDRLLERVARASSSDARAVRRVVHAIT